MNGAFTLEEKQFPATTPLYAHRETGPQNCHILSCIYERKKMFGHPVSLNEKEPLFTFFYVNEDL